MNLLEKLLSNIEPILIKGFYYRKRIFHKGYAKYTVCVEHGTTMYILLCYVTENNVKRRLENEK